MANAELGMRSAELNCYVALAGRFATGFVFGFSTPIFGQMSFKRADFALGIAGDANPSPMVNHSVAEGNPLPAGADSSIKSRSTFTGSVCLVSPRRMLSRPTCVSTTTPDGMPKAVPRTTLAVLRPTPAKLDQRLRGLAALRRHGFPTSSRQHSLMLLALLRKKPVLWMIRSISDCGAWARSSAVG